MASELVGRCRLKLAETRAPQDKSKCDQMMTEVKTLFNAQSGGICPNLVEFYDAFWEDPFMYLAMEYMDCGSLDVPFKRCAQVRPISDLSPSMPRPSMRARTHTHTCSRLFGGAGPSRVGASVNCGGKNGATDHE